jgi:hypothetical protein
LRKVVVLICLDLRQVVFTCRDLKHVLFICLDLIRIAIICSDSSKIVFNCFDLNQFVLYLFFSFEVCCMYVFIDLARDPQGNIYAMRNFLSSIDFNKSPLPT